MACGNSQPKTKLGVNLIDFAYNPNQYLVPAGKDITLNIVNNGAVVHNFIIMEAGTNIGENFDQEDEVYIYWKMELAPGQSTTMSFTAPSERGEYLITCSMLGQHIASMTAKLVVVAQ
jgi:heme/copper-type cytochrome/quinol oxidase subunit 2